MNRFIFWTPRILAIVFILFLSLFSLDIFEGNYGFWGTVVGLFMHNLPSIFLAIVLWISWKKEIVGGVVFTLAGVLFLLLPFGNIIIAVPAILIGILFLISWFRKNK